MAGKLNAATCWGKPKTRLAKRLTEKKRVKNKNCARYVNVLLCMTGRDRELSKIGRQDGRLAKPHLAAFRSFAAAMKQPKNEV
jgi:hypothetical protein